MYNTILSYQKKKATMTLFSFITEWEKKQQQTLNLNLNHYHAVYVTYSDYGVYHELLGVLASCWVHDTDVKLQCLPMCSAEEEEE